MTDRPMTTTPAPPLILIIKESVIERMPAANAAGIRGCEAQYHAGAYYITVPADVYSQWKLAEANR